VAGRGRSPGRRAATLALLLVAGLAPACRRDDRAAAPPPGALIVSMSLAEDERDPVRALLDRFTRETGIPVVLTSIATDDLPERLRVDRRAGRPTLDLFAQDNLGLRVLVDEDLVQPLDDVPVPTEVSSAMRPPPVDSHRYFLPFRPNVQVTYVNRARLRAAGVDPPRTVAELRAVARRLRDAGRGLGRVTLSLAQGAPATVTLCEWIVGFGGDPLVLNDAGSAAALEALQGLWREGLLARESLLARYDTQVDFLTGETAWVAPNWPFTSGVLADQDVLDRFDVYEGWRGPVRPAHVVGGDVLGMPHGIAGGRRTRAVQLARFLMSRDAQELLVERNGWPSIRGDAYARVPAGRSETFAAIERALADGWYRPNVAYWAAVDDALNEAVRRIVVGPESARPVLDDLAGRLSAARGSTAVR
jgi:trehalose transport system substrate-binding protein